MQMNSDQRITKNLTEAKNDEQSELHA